MREENVEKLRGVVRDCVSKHLYSSAIFFADKVAALTQDAADIYMQAQTLFLGRQYRRALHILNASQIIPRDLRFRYLAAKCLEELKEWHQCLSMLGEATVDEHGNVHDLNDCNIMYLDKDGEDREINLPKDKIELTALNRACYLVYLYKAAIKADPLCYEYDKESVVEAQFTELEKENGGITSSDSSFTHSLKNNTDLLLERDPFHLKSTLVHLAAAMELGHSNELYLMASSLVKDYPQKLEGFGKATTLDTTFAPAWIGSGNAYAAQEEGDQAMNAFRTTARLFPG
ncbi:hypothetical protein ACLOJK_008739 [Asimina triloba]